MIELFSISLFNDFDFISKEEILYENRNGTFS